MNVARTTQLGNAELPQPAPLLVDEVEAARLLGISRPTLRNWIAAGLLNRVDMPFGIRRNLIRVSDVENLVASLARDKS